MHDGEQWDYIHSHLPHTSSGIHTNVFTGTQTCAKLYAQEKPSQMSQNGAESLATESESRDFEEILLYFLILPDTHCEKIVLCLVRSVASTMAVGLGRDTLEGCWALQLNRTPLLLLGDEGERASRGGAWQSRALFSGTHFS